MYMTLGLWTKRIRYTCSYIALTFNGTNTMHMLTCIRAQPVKSKGNPHSQLYLVLLSKYNSLLLLG
jgi:hypothetical protein